MIASFIELERIVRRAPLGLRCFDLVNNQPVSEGLSVTARHVSGSGEVLAAYRSPVSGIFGFRSLPGLKDYELDLRPASDYCPPASSDAPQNRVVTVADTAGRFLPLAFSLCLPQERVVLVQLFSAPARAVPAGFGAVRATLWDSAANQPAAWALMAATTPDGNEYVAMADARGVVTLPVLYPAPEVSPLFGTVPFGQLTWPLTLTVKYQPGRHKHLAALPEDAPPEAASLLAQAAAAFGGGAPSIVEDLAYRQDLILKTMGNPKSRLLIQPAPPPP